MESHGNWLSMSETAEDKGARDKTVTWSEAQELAQPGSWSCNEDCLNQENQLKSDFSARALSWLPAFGSLLCPSRHLEIYYLMRVNHRMWPGASQTQVRAWYTSNGAWSDWRLAASPHPLTPLSSQNLHLPKNRSEDYSRKYDQFRRKDVKILNQRFLSKWPARITLEWSSKFTSLTHSPGFPFSVVEPPHCEQTSKDYLIREGLLQHGRHTKTTNSKAICRIHTMQEEESSFKY